MLSRCTASTGACTFAQKECQPWLRGSRATVPISLQPVAYEFERGHRVRLALAGADADNFEQPPDAAPPPTAPPPKRQRRATTATPVSAAAMHAPEAGGAEAMWRVELEGLRALAAAQQQQIAQLQRTLAAALDDGAHAHAEEEEEEEEEV